MSRVRVLLCMAVGMLFTAGWLSGQEKKDEAKKDPPPILKGQLPTYWNKLGLSKEQTQTVYRIQTDYRGKIDQLKQQIAKLQTQEKEDLGKVLLPAQKERLREIILSKAPPGDTGTKEKKPGDTGSKEKKSDDK